MKTVFLNLHILLIFKFIVLYANTLHTQRHFIQSITCKLTGEKLNSYEVSDCIFTNLKCERKKHRETVFLWNLWNCIFMAVSYEWPYINTHRTETIFLWFVQIFLMIEILCNIGKNTGEKSFFCDICGYAFSQNLESLNTHWREGIFLWNLCICIFK